MRWKGTHVINNVFFTPYRKDNKTYSRVGILNSGCFARIISAISSRVTLHGEQLYLPFAFGCSSRKMCALAKSSTCAIGKRTRAPN